MNRYPSEFSSQQETEEIISDIKSQIKDILDKDLSILKKDKRTIGQWMSIFGRDITYDETKHQLIDLEGVEIDAKMFSRQ